MHIYIFILFFIEFVREYHKWGCLFMLYYKKRDVERGLSGRSLFWLVENEDSRDEL